MGDNMVIKSGNGVYCSAIASVTVCITRKCNQMLMHNACFSWAHLLDLHNLQIVCNCWSDLAMWKHINANNIILHHQHGFQASFSCQTQLVEAVHDWASSIYNHKQTEILLDFSKACDTVLHKRLSS